VGDNKVTYIEMIKDEAEKRRNNFYNKSIA